MYIILKQKIFRKLLFLKQKIHQELLLLVRIHEEQKML